ncbi:MAG: peroxide stress protein YaaA, partial [Pseudomonadota bacterium]
NSLSKADLDWAQDHLRMLSGLYGVLRPLDAIQPYRLEMGTKLKTRRGETLYKYWGDRISKALNEDLSADDVVLNLASNEYFKAVDKKALNARVVEAVFWETKGGKSRPLFMYTKRARGLMARYVIENRIDDVDDVKAFDVEGYTYDAAASTEDKLVFIRPQPKPKSK